MNEYDKYVEHYGVPKDYRPSLIERIIVKIKTILKKKK